MTGWQRCWHLVREGVNLPVTLLGALIALSLIVWRDYTTIDRDEFGPGDRYSAFVVHLEKPIGRMPWTLTLGNVVIASHNFTTGYRSEIMGWEQWPLLWPIVRRVRRHG